MFCVPDDIASSGVASLWRLVTVELSDVVKDAAVSDKVTQCRLSLGQLTTQTRIEEMMFATGLRLNKGHVDVCTAVLDEGLLLVTSRDALKGQNVTLASVLEMLGVKYEPASLLPHPLSLLLVHLTLHHG